MVITGPLNDRGVVWMSRRNGGTYEPEFRLVFMFGMLFGIFGYVGWAIGTQHNMPWIGAVACITYVFASNLIGHGEIADSAINWAQDDELQHGRLGVCGCHVPTRHAPRGRTTYTGSHELCKEHGPLCVHILCKRHHHQSWCEGRASYSRRMSGVLLAGIDSDVYLRKASPVICESTFVVFNCASPSSWVSTYRSPVILVSSSRKRTLRKLQMPSNVEGR